MRLPTFKLRTMMALVAIAGLACSLATVFWRSYQFDKLYRQHAQLKRVTLLNRAVFWLNADRQNYANGIAGLTPSQVSELQACDRLLDHHDKLMRLYGMLSEQPWLVVPSELPTEVRWSEESCAGTRDRGFRHVVEFFMNPFGWFFLAIIAAFVGIGAFALAVARSEARIRTPNGVSSALPIPD